MTELYSGNTEAVDLVYQEVYKALVSGPHLPGQSYLATFAEKRIQNPESSEQTRDQHLLAMHTAQLFASLQRARQRRQLSGLCCMFAKH